MRVAVFAGHVGSEGLHPSGKFGGGEAHTLAFLQILRQYYDVTAIVQNGVYPNFDQADSYGYDLHDLEWRPVGDSFDWVRQYDTLLSINHGIMAPPICRRNILVTFFPQYPQWDVSGFDTIVANSNYTAGWIKQYWGREAEVIYPPVPVRMIQEQAAGFRKTKRIVCIGRFFEVPGGNNKQHLTVLNAFKDMMLPDWELLFIGSVQNQSYLNRIKRQAADDPRIKFAHDLSRTDYLRAIGEAAFVWSATGYEAKHPSSREHFGVFTAEAMAMGTIPIVHNSGGSPESGCLTWETPTDLIETTKELTRDYDKLLAIIGEMSHKAQEFDISRSAERLVAVLEKPLVIEPNPMRSKIFVPELAPKDIKVALISDSPMDTTGFGTVTRGLVQGLLQRGYRVVCWGLQDPYRGVGRLTPEDVEAIVRDELGKSAEGAADRIAAKIRDKELCTIWRGCEHDAAGWGYLQKFLDTEKPDVIYINYDPGNIRIILDTLRNTRCSAPLVVYLPIEGKPVIPQYVEVIRLVRVLNGEVVCYTKWGSDAVFEANGPRLKWVHHGMDHANFRLPDPVHRQMLRQAVGWDNKTVLVCVGRNKRTKGWGAILQVARKLKEMGRDEFVWYLHTNPHDAMQNSSMPLDQLAHINGLSDRILFPPDLELQTKGIPYDEPIVRGAVPDTGNIKEVWRHNLSTMSMIERYWLGDIYVNLSELEGFGMPPLEAMGCGLPVISVDDQGVQQEVLGGAPLYIPVSHWDPTWHTGGMLAQVNPDTVARAIVDLKDKPELMAELSAASRTRYEQFTWGKTVDFLSQVILKQVN